MVVGVGVVFQKQLAQNTPALERNMKSIHKGLGKPLKKFVNSTQRSNLKKIMEETEVLKRTTFKQEFTEQGLSITLCKFQLQITYLPNTISCPKQETPAGRYNRVKNVDI